MAALSLFSGRDWKVLLCPRQEGSARDVQEHARVNQNLRSKLENPASHLGEKSSIPIVPSGADQHPDWESHVMNDHIHFFSH